MDRFGDNLYNTYGSTEVAYASIATPEDMRKSPSTAGKPPWATVVKIYDEKSDKELPQGESGRIFVGNSLLFEGYTGGGQKDMIDGLMSSGDVGRFDEDGLLYVEGRDDEMIVSGGENVFPKEVEDCLARHDAVVEVAAIGVDDDDFGKRLRAFVVLPRRHGRLRGRAQGARQGQPGALQGAARDRDPRRAAAQRHRQGPQARPRRRGTHGRPGRGRVTGLELGTPAPDFTLRDQFGQDVSLSSYRGEKAVAIVFYPYAFSGVCTGEMAGIRDRLAELMTFGSEVLAVSCDPVYALRAFADADGLNFPLLSDFWPHGEVCRAYDVFNEVKGARAARRTSSTGRAWCAGRCTATGPRATSTSTSGSSRSTPDPRLIHSRATVRDGSADRGLDHSEKLPRFGLSGLRRPATVCRVEPLVTRDASGSAHFLSTVGMCRIGTAPRIVCAAPVGAVAGV